MKTYRYLRYVIVLLWVALPGVFVYDYCDFLADPREYTRYHGENINYMRYHAVAIFIIFWAVIGILLPLLPSRYGRKAVNIPGYACPGMFLFRILSALREISRD